MTSSDKSIVITSPYEEPAQHWSVEENAPEKREICSGRRPAAYLPPRENEPPVELELVNRLRPLVKGWREEAMRGGGGVSKTTMDLLNYWRREGREHRLFFAQLEAAETVIFLAEARADYLQGIDIPSDEPSENSKGKGYKAFPRWCCKLATGGGKTTVMAMLAAWSILNKAADRRTSRYSDAVLVLCPNVTIRSRLEELIPQRGDASIYRTRDLVPSSLMSTLAQGKVLPLNWHVLEARSSSAGGRVLKTGRPVVIAEKVFIGDKTETMRGKRYMTEGDLRDKAKLGLLEIIREEKHKTGGLKSVDIRSEKYVETDDALVRRVLKRDFGGKKNILVMNDEAHHARRLPDDKDAQADAAEIGDDETAEVLHYEATVWMEGLDKINKVRGIGRCLDFSATPYFLGDAGENAGRIFPWTVSDFCLSDAIESGLVKAPRFSVRTSDGGNSYYDLWSWILKQLQPGERGPKKGPVKPGAVLKYANAALELMVTDWEKTRKKWEKDGEARPPVFIVVCKNVKLAQAVYKWLAENENPRGVPPCRVESLRNTGDVQNTVRIDSKVSQEIESGEAKSDETKWMRFMLDTVGKTEWPKGPHGRPIYPPDFEKLAEKMERPKSPPGRSLRAIVSVSMLTEGWDCSTVTHIVGLRPFMSQLLCEQVVGRGLRRANYETDEKDLPSEEVATVFGVPFRTVPVKAANGDHNPVPRWRIHAVREKAEYAISYPRVEGYRSEIHARLKVDFSSLSELNLNESPVPTEADVGVTTPPDQPAVGGSGGGG